MRPLRTSTLAFAFAAVAFTSVAPAAGQPIVEAQTEVAAARRELGQLDRDRPSDARQWAETQRRLGDLLGDLDDGRREENLEGSIAAYRSALEFFTRNTAPNDWAYLQNALGVALGDRIRGDKRENIEQALSTLRAALDIYTREHDPEAWAMVMNNIGATLDDRVAGSRAANVEAAIAAFREALQVRTKEATPEEFAVSAKGLAAVLRHRVLGSKRENLEQEAALLKDVLDVHRKASDPGAAVAVERELGLLYLRTGELGAPGDTDRGIAMLDHALSLDEPGLSPDDRADALQLLGRAHEARTTGDPADDMERAIAAYQQALVITPRDRRPDRWTSLEIDLGTAYKGRIRGERARNVERAITAFSDALSAIDRRADPDNWAIVQNNLGTAHDDRIDGDRETNVGAAITAYRAALSVTHRDGDPEFWGTLQNNLGVAYSHRSREHPDDADRAIRCFELALQVRTALHRGGTLNNLGEVYLRRAGGDRSANIEAALEHLRAAASLRTQGADPAGWAQTTDNIGTALFERIGGDRAKNLEDAITAYEQSLEVRTRGGLPRDWAATQNNLALALVDRLKGDHAQNIERAIDAYQAALTVVTKDGDPENWAAIEDNLAQALQDRRVGNRNDNIERAIAAYDLALQVRTPARTPLQWAGTAGNKAIALGKRGKDRIENTREAIRLLRDVLKVRTRRSMPVEWAQSMNSLGAALSEGFAEGVVPNMEEAIEAYQLALEVRTRAALPENWAATKNNLAILFMRRAQGGNTADIEDAIALYHEALQVRTRGGDPLDFIATQKGLANAYARRQTGDPQENRRSGMEAYQAAIRAVDDLIGDGLDPWQTSVVMEAAGELFRSAALQLAVDGDPAGSLALAERGRTRALQLAFHLASAAQALPPDRKERLDRLRTALRGIRSKLDAGAPRNSSDAAAIATERQQLRQQAEALHSQIADLLPGPGTTTVPPVPVPDGGAIVVPVVAGNGAVLLIMTSAGLESLALPGFDDARMRQMFLGGPGEGRKGGWARGQDAISQNGSEELPDVWRTSLANFERDAWTYLAEPMTQRLGELGVQPGAKVVLVTQDYLARMPLWLARQPGSGMFLGDLYRITTSPNLAALSAKVQGGPADVAAWFNERARPELPLTSLAKGLFESGAKGATMVAADDATRASSLLERLQGHQNWLLWTHGRFDRGDPRASGLQLASDDPSVQNTLLTVGELLAARFEHGGPDLVVLSACESGLADVSRDDELVGIPTAFIAAGARGVVSALWPVREDATAFLTAKFGELAFKDGQPPSEALRNAQRWLREATAADLLDYLNQQVGHPPPWSGAAKAYESIASTIEGDLAARPYADPYYWAAFNFAGADEALSQMAPSAPSRTTPDATHASP